MVRRRAATVARLEDDPRKVAASLTPAMARALHWLPGDVTLARFAALHRGSDTPTANTLRGLELRGLVRAITLTGWWRLTDVGVQVRQHTTGTHEAERVA